ncbi:hypothetical protein GGX14DRAFT_497875 [Mycena pura]|uniref:Kinetochore protein n=1 Tax=Mycena pura TaxID=153505 RepID=A0AAD6YGH7_9AGAR|nr:hypothetical protein GGX14DRAFT_497875 [Mycena pura]
MDHDEQLPRISLESMRVWLRIKSDFAREVEAQANGYAKQHNLPPQRRIQFLESAKNYVEETFAIAQANIRINGRDFDSLQPHEQDAEPFDEALDRNIWALAGHRLEWHQKIATERREKPLKFEKTLKDLFKEHEALDAELNAEQPSLVDLEDPKGSELNVDSTVADRILAVTGELSQSIPTQQERSERSRVVEAEIKALRP